MNGRNHLAAGGSIFGLSAAAAVCADINSEFAFLRVIDTASKSIYHWLSSGQSFYTIQGAAIAAACVAFYFAGLVLPDIDLDGSTVSKLFHFSIPVTHRGLTHSVWLMIIAVMCGMSLWRPVCMLGAGMLVHDLCDWPSQAGWVPFYPFGRYKKMHNTIFARNHWIVFYSSSVSNSERVFTGVIVMICVLLTAFVAYLALWPS